MKTNQKTSKHSNSEKGNIVNDDWIIQACFKAEEYRREQARKQAKKLLPWVMLILLPFIVCLVLLFIYHGIGAVVGTIGALFVVFIICAIIIR